MLPQCAGWNPYTFTKNRAASPFSFNVCLSVSAFKGLSALETHKHLHATGTHVYFDFVQPVYDYGLASQYLDFAGKAKRGLFIFPQLLCAVNVFVLYVRACANVREDRAR